MERNQQPHPAQASLNALMGGASSALQSLRTAITGNQPQQVTDPEAVGYELPAVDTLTESRETPGGTTEVRTELPVIEPPEDPAEAWAQQEQRFMAQFPAFEELRTRLTPPPPPPPPAEEAPAEEHAPAPADDHRQREIDALAAHARRLAGEMMLEPEHTQPQDVSLPFAPKRIEQNEFNALKPHDLSAYPRAKGIIIYSNLKKDTPPDEQTKFSVKIRRAGQDVPVEFTPNTEDMTKGAVKAEGNDGLTTPVEYDFIRRQWTTPSQRLACFALQNDIVQREFAALLENEEIKSRYTDSVKTVIDQLIESAEASVASFYRGDITYSQLQEEMQKKKVEITNKASDKKSRDHAKYRQYMTWGVGSALTVTSLASLMVWRFTQ